MFPIIVNNNYYKYDAEGHDIVSPSDIKEVNYFSHGVKGVVASVITVDNQQERRMVTKILFISQCKNFKFTTDGVLCRKAYDVGLGHFLPANIKD